MKITFNHRREWPHLRKKKWRLVKQKKKDVIVTNKKGPASDWVALGLKLIWARTEPRIRNESPQCASVMRSRPLWGISGRMCQTEHALCFDELADYSRIQVRGVKKCWFFFYYYFILSLIKLLRNVLAFFFLYEDTLIWTRGTNFEMIVFCYIYSRRDWIWSQDRWLDGV